MRSKRSVPAMLAAVGVTIAAGAIALHLTDRPCGGEFVVVSSFEK